MTNTYKNSACGELTVDLVFHWGVCCPGLWKKKKKDNFSLRRKPAYINSLTDNSIKV
jgi:hypothetical protein